MEIKELVEERKYLQKLVDESFMRLSKSPKGTLYVKRMKHTCYFIKLDQKIEYLSKKKDYELINKLLQKKRDLKIIKNVSKQISLIDDFLIKYNPCILSEINKKYPELDEIPEYHFFSKSVSDATINMQNPKADDTDLARNLIAVCTAFLQSKGC